jgi:hypothetical protein
MQKILEKSRTTKSNKELLELRRDHSKVAGYKVHAQKSIALLYISNE